MNERETVTNKIFEGKISIREFLADFFGALMPGVVFLVLVLPAIVIPILYLIQCLDYFNKKIKGNLEFTVYQNVLRSVDKEPGIFLVGLFFLFLVLGYVMGTIFYRRDLKEPDYRSFLTTVKKFSSEHLKNWVVQPRNIKNGNKIITNPIEINKRTVDGSQVQFPYNNLKRYLEARGRPDLSELVTWKANSSAKPNSRNSIGPRSKAFINGMKIQLEYFCPEHCSTIIKNEAHCRLSSSLWYVVNYVRKLAMFGLIVFCFFPATAVVVFDSWSIFARGLNEFLFSIVLCGGTLWLAYRMRINIEEFFHYQRVREIFYVLETYNEANRLIINKNEIPPLVEMHS